MTIRLTSSGALREFLRRDHARIEGLHARLMDSLDHEDPGLRRDAWSRFSSAVLDHMAAEERHLLRPFGKVQEREAAELRAQHAEFRRHLARLAVDFDGRRSELHTFITALCRHARREDELLYRWAEQELAGAMREDIARELSGKGSRR